MANYTCPRCNNKVAFEDKVCPHCGYRNPAAASAYSGCLFIVGLAVVIYLLFGSPSLFPRSNPESTEPTNVPVPTVSLSNNDTSSRRSVTYLFGEWRLEVPESADIWWASSPGWERASFLVILTLFLLIIARFKYISHIALIGLLISVVVTVFTKNLFWLVTGVAILMLLGSMSLLTPSNVPQQKV